MLVSLNKIKSYVPDIKISAEELIKLIGSRLVEVEGYTDLAPKYQGIKIVKVLSAEPIPDTHLHLCQISAGSDDPIQVVCGAPNVHAGMLTAWIMPGSIVPATYGNENFKLDVRKLRGYESHGMLAAADELDLGTDHAGIIEIDPRDAHPGDNFADVFDLNDIILDIENKSLTHRPDCFGLIGFAREVSGILGLPFNEGLVASTVTMGAEAGKVAISISDPAICPRYSCAVLDCAKLLKKGKYFTAEDAFLGKLGMRGISPIVDLTNILMLETGQPLHAFDYDKFVQVGGAASPKVIVRLASPGEKLQLLDGKTIDCTDTDILITSNNVPVALAGAMGGASTEIDASTTKIILESATFSLYNLRKTQMAHGIFSEAITRFTKGQPASQTLPVLEEAIRRLGTTPISISDCYPSPAKPIVVKITTKEINNLLGTKYDTNKIKNALEGVGFKVDSAVLAQSLRSGFAAAREDGPKAKLAAESTLKVTAPSWRTDIHIKEDIIEEVGRLLGFDNIKKTLPPRTFASTPADPMWRLKSTLRRILSDQLGAHELLTYSFISGDLIDKVGESQDNFYKIINSISPELQYFRTSLTPSLLDKVYQNLRDGHQNFTIYEINQVVNKSEPLDQDHVPVSHTHLSVLTFGDFYQIKSIAAALNDQLRITNPYTLFTSGPAYFEPAHSATDTLGSFGEIKNSVLRRFKLGDYTISALEWDIDSVPSLPQSPAQLASLAFAKFPSVSRDLTFKTPDHLTFGAISEGIKEVLVGENLLFELTPLSIYQAEDEQSARNISFHLIFANPTKTLGNEEISAIIEKVTAKITKLGAKAV